MAAQTRQKTAVGRLTRNITRIKATGVQDNKSGTRNRSKLCSGSQRTVILVVIKLLLTTHCQHKPQFRSNQTLKTCRIGLKEYLMDQLQLLI